MTESFRGRLRRLRRESDEDPPRSAEERVANEAPAPRRELSLELRGRLRGAQAKRRTQAPAPASPDDGGLWPRSIAELGGIEVVARGATEDECFAARTTWFHEAWRHGEWRLLEIDAADAADFHVTTGDARLADLDLRRAVYLDTETTGLSGGAGTSVFMIGLGRFVGDRFELWQGFLRSPAEERELLAECAQRIARSAGVVSFFGKSFDRHRLEDKMRVHGVTPPFDAVPHLDLCHPLRRLYRAALPDARLRTMESELVGVQRADDLPGAYAPEAWFDFLAGRPHRVEGVFQHNLDDVLSLATLAAHLGRSSAETRADGSPLTGCPSARAAGLAKSHQSTRDRDAALAWLERALERTRNADRARDLALERAEALRLARRDADSLAAYRDLAAAPQDRHSPAILLGLAKLVEHHTKDRAGALELCRTALCVLDRQLVGGSYARLKRELTARIARLSNGA
ncbi:MAG: ribonuclease H-like domain-containing protein [Planctomycetes bacterium]|nr:ribonuclease H-like domain-containing protein [Planctomycetota bacterium]MCB9905210.1 ribonuclease H-like domain-containing protein [Planctomycetota bacterium]